MVTLYAERAKANTLSTNEFIDSLPLPCCIFNTDLELTDFSKSAALLFEASSDEMLGKSPDLWQAVNIGDKKHFSGLLLQVFSGAEPRLVHEFTHKLPSGDVILCEWNFSQYQPTDAKPWVIALIKPLNTSNNRLATQEGSGWSLRSLLGLASLKSELGKRSEELRQLNLILQEKDKRLMTILHNIPVGICVASTGSFTGEMNSAYLNLFGYSAEELRTMSLESITHPDDLQWNTRVISEVMEGRSDRADYEKRYIRKDGGIVWVKVTMVPLKDAEGRTYNVIAVAQDITAQKQAEQFMAQQQELIRMGGKAARMGYWMRDPGVDSATFWSDELFEFYECDDKVVLPIDKVFAMHLPGYRSLAQTLFEQLTLEGKRMEYECELITLKGSHKWLRVVGDVIWSSSGKIAKIIGAIQDISERKQQQLESLRLNDRISSTMDTMSEAFMIIDRNWESIFMNKAAETLLKTRRDVLHNGSLWDQQPWMKTSVLYEGYHQAMNGKQPFNAEYFSPRLNDWMETWAYPCDEGIAVYYHSISDKKRLLAQVQASEQKLKYVAKATLDVMWERNLADNSIQWDSGLRKWGYPGNTDDGKSLTASGFWLQRIHAQEQDAVISSLDSVLKSRHDHWEATYRFRKADGSYIHVMDRGVVFRDKELQPVKMIGGMTDISERIRLEEHFQQAQRIDSIGKLTGGLAHDFNNLLTVILGSSELLYLHVAGDPDAETLTKSISSSALRGADLTRRLLAFARRQALEPAPLNLNRLLLNIEGLLKRSLAGNVDIRIKTSQGLHTALVDSNQLESAILNLCINSRDAMPLGGEIMLETMNITLGKESTGFLEEVVPGDYVAIKVTDNGAGIPQHLLGRVFEPFFTTKDLGKGTGLGLSTVYGFLRQSNGYITIASTLGIGTEVILYLPITLQQEKHPDKREQRPRYAGGNELILLVEDDAAVSSFASQFLSSLGYTVLLAASGEAALVLLKQRNDIVMLFTDIIMPGGMDGGELAKKALELDPALKVLYTSGYTDNALIKEGNLDPNVNFLTKPYTLNTMANRIRETLDRGKSDNAVGREKPPG